MSSVFQLCIACVPCLWLSTLHITRPRFWLSMLQTMLDCSHQHDFIFDWLPQREGCILAVDLLHVALVGPCAAVLMASVHR